MAKKPRQSKDQELGTRPVGRLLFDLALPAVLGQLVNLLYNIVDRIFIGNMPVTGNVALSALGVAMPVVMMIGAFAFLVGMGGAPRAAIALGAGERDHAEKILGNAVTMLVLIAAVLTAVFLTFNETFLWFFGASDATIGYAMEYMQMYTIGTIFVMLALGLNPFISTQGYAKMSMVTITIGAALNIALDPLFIYTFDMGVRGAALATIISQGVSAVWVVTFHSLDRDRMRIRPKHLRLKGSVVLSILALGLSPFIMNITESFLMVVFNKNLFRYGGDNAIGAMTIMNSAMSFSFLPLSGISQGAQPIISFNYGAKKPERMQQAFHYLLRSALVYSGAFFAFIMIAPHVFARLFTPDPTLLALTSRGLRVYMFGTLAMAVQISCQQTFLALGKAKVSIFLALLRKIILLIPLIYLLPHLLRDQLFAVWLAEPVADIISATTAGLLFRKHFKNTIADLRGPDHEDTLPA